MICERHNIELTPDGSCAQCDREAEILGESYRRAAITYRRDVRHPLGTYTKRHGHEQWAQGTPH